MSTNESHDNTFDFSLGFFGCGSDEDLYGAVEAASGQRLEDWLVAYRRFAASTRMRAAPLGNDEIRPYFQTESFRYPNWLMSGVDAGADTWTVADQIKHRLLYSHSLAIDDELGMRIAVCLGKMVVSDPNAKDKLLAYINLLTHFAPLIRSQVLCLVSPAIYLEDTNGYERDQLASELTKAIGGAYSADLAEIVAAAPQELQTQWARSLADGGNGAASLHKAHASIACQRIAKSCLASSDVPGRLTLYFPFTYDVRLLKTALAAGHDLHASTRIPDDQNRLLHELARLQLPGLSELDPQELVAIRSHSDEFERWRSTLRKALGAARQQPDDLWNHAEATRRAIVEVLSEGKRELEQSLRHSKTLAGLNKASTSFIVGAAVAPMLSPGAALGSLLVAVLLRAIAAGVERAIETKATPDGQVSAQRAARAHYIAMLG